jgi:hypothetical protein
MCIILEILRQEAKRLNIAIEPLTKDQLELQMHRLLKKETMNTFLRLK